MDQVRTGVHRPGVSVFRSPNWFLQVYTRHTKNANNFKVFPHAFETFLLNLKFGFKLLQTLKLSKFSNKWFVWWSGALPGSYIWKKSYCFVFQSAILCSFRSLSVWGGRLLCSYDINIGSYWTETVEEGTDSNCTSD